MSNLNIGTKYKLQFNNPIRTQEELMKAQVLHNYDPDMKQEVWVKEEEVPDPKLEKASDVIVKIGAAGVCRPD